MRAGIAALALFAAAGGCAPVMPMPDSPRADALRATAAEFCAARSARDSRRLTALFAPELARALEAALDAGAAPPLTSRDTPGDCTPGRTAYWGGSRHFVELRYPGHSDALDLWLSDQGRISDLQYGDRPGGLRQALGLRVGAVKPENLFPRRD